MSYQTFVTVIDIKTLKLFSMERYVTHVECIWKTAKEHQVVDRWATDEISVW